MDNCVHKMASAKDGAKGGGEGKAKIPSYPIVNPVLVTVGQEVLPHQTPIYAWQLEGDDGKLLNQNDQTELKINYSGQNTALLQSMYDYTIVPSAKIKGKMDYFYTPYNQKFLLRKHMTFEDQSHEAAEAEKKGDEPQVKPVMQSSLEFMQKGGGEIITDVKSSNTRQSETEGQEHVPLRDRVFTKEEITQLEKKTWIEIKDLIFETDKSILDYLGFHCQRWRKT